MLQSAAPNSWLVIERDRRTSRSESRTALNERVAHFAARVVTDREARNRLVRTQLQSAGHVTLNRQAVSIATGCVGPRYW